jgi:hypothetical protein
MALGRTTTPPPLPGPGTAEPMRHRARAGSPTCPRWPTSLCEMPMCRCDNRLDPVADPVRWTMIMAIIKVYCVHAF